MPGLIIERAATVSEIPAYVLICVHQEAQTEVMFTQERQTLDEHFKELPKAAGRTCYKLHQQFS